jgi:MFS family permease
LVYALAATAAAVDAQALPDSTFSNPGQAEAQGTDAFLTKANAGGESEIATVGFEKVSGADIGRETLRDERDKVRKSFGRLPAFLGQVADFFQRQDVMVRIDRVDNQVYRLPVVGSPRRSAAPNRVRKFQFSGRVCDSIRPTPRPMRTLIVLIAINILNFYDRNVIGALTEPIRKEFHLSDTQVGLIGSAFIWLYAIVGVPLGRLADRRSRKKLLAGGMTVWSLLTAMAALASTYGMLLASRLGFAVGEAVVAPAATSWIGDLFPPDKRARPLAMFMVGVPVGGALSYFLSGPIAQAWGWRMAMVAAAVPAVLLIPLLLRLKEPARGASEGVLALGGKASPLMLLRIPTFLWIIVSGALLNFNMYALGQFMPAFLSRIHHVSLAHAGVGTGIAYAVGGISGSVIAGWVGDRIIRRRKDGRLLCAAGLVLMGGPAAWFGINAGDVTTSVALITLFYGSLCSYYGLVYSSIQDIVAPQMRGIAMAIYFMCMYLCGASFGPLLTGRVSDLMARRAADAAGSGVVTEVFRAVGLQQAMLIMPVLSVVLALVLFAGSRTIVRDAVRSAG